MVGQVLLTLRGQGARLNCIDHLLKQFPYCEVHKAPVVLPQRERHEHYSRQAVPAAMLVPEIY